MGVLWVVKWRDWEAEVIVIKVRSGGTYREGLVLYIQQKARRGHHRCCNDDGMSYELPIYMAHGNRRVASTVYIEKARSMPLSNLQFNTAENL